MTGGNAPRYISHAERWPAQEARSTSVADWTPVDSGCQPGMSPTPVNPTLHIRPAVASRPIPSCIIVSFGIFHFIDSEGQSRQTPPTTFDSHVQSRFYTRQGWLFTTYIYICCRRMLVLQGRLFQMRVSWRLQNGELPIHYTTAVMTVPVVTNNKCNKNKPFRRHLLRRKPPPSVFFHRIT